MNVQNEVVIMSPVWNKSCVEQSESVYYTQSGSKYVMVSVEELGYCWTGRPTRSSNSRL